MAADDEKVFWEPIREMLRTLRTVQLTTIDSDGYPISRVVENTHCLDRFPEVIELYSGKDEYAVYFSTHRSMGKIHQITANPKGSVFYCRPDAWCTMLVIGDIAPVLDRDIEERIWNDDWLEIFPMGVDDPDRAIFKLEPRSIRAMASIDGKVLRRTIDLRRR